MNIYEILSSIPHNKHYLNRYYKFINRCCIINLSLDKTVYTEDHHICPKAVDLFPEYTNLKLFPWNKITLTARQHFIAHWLLWKVYGGSQTGAFWSINHQQSPGNQTFKKVNSRVYESIKKDFSIRQSKNLTDRFKNDRDLKSIISKSITKRNIENNPSKLQHNREASSKRLSERLKDPLQNPNSNPKNIEAARMRKILYWQTVENTNCPHCDLSSKSKGLMKRYHFDNCKHKISE